MSGDNSIVECPLFQTEDGSAILTSPLQISQYRLAPCNWTDLVPILEQYHYRKGMMGGSIKICLGVWADGVLVGGGVFGNPWHPESYSGGGGNGTALNYADFAFTMMPRKIPSPGQ